MFVKKQIPVTGLEVGMYVSELDRPWLETPFLFQGFPINDDIEIKELKKYCEYVYVDLEQSKERYQARKKSKSNLAVEIHNQETIESTYQDLITVEEELETARDLRQKSNEMVSSIMDDVRAGKVFDIEGLADNIESMVESIIRNPDALVCLTRLKDQDSYTYSHSIDVCSYMLAFGRHLGFSKEQLKILGMGGLLQDVGKAKLPQSLLEHTGKLNAEELELARRHVTYSIEIVKELRAIPLDVVDMIYAHHERFDGSGYPLGVSGNKISMYSSMAGIVDSYDALISDRSYAKAVSSTHALHYLFQQRNCLFKDTLAEQFIQCIGIYSVGSLVELNTSEIGIVISQNRIRQLKPKVMLVLDKDKSPLVNPQTIDLILEPIGYGGKPYEISRALKPGAYGIDPKEYYL